MYGCVRRLWAGLALLAAVVAPAESRAQVFTLACSGTAFTFDLSLQTPAARQFADEYYLQAYVGGAEDRTDPDISPLYADLRGMPPAIFSVGTLDPLLDDSLFMAARWRAAGNHAELRVWPEAIHGFIAFPLAMALIVWVIYNGVGIKKHGFFGYLKHVLLPPGAPAPEAHRPAGRRAGNAATSSPHLRGC